MLSSLDISRILAESSRLLIEADISAVEYYRKERTVQVYFKSTKRYCLTMSFHPQRSGFYILPAGKSRLDTTEKYRPFAREVWSGKLISIIQVPNDRIIELSIENQNKRFILIMEVIGPNGNIWLLNDQRQKISSLRNKKFKAGEEYQPPPLPQKLDLSGVTTDDLARILESSSGANLARTLEKNIYGLDYYLAQAMIEDYPEASDLLKNLTHLRDNLHRLADAYTDAERAIYAYRIKGKTHYYSIRIKSLEAVAKFKTLSDAQRALMSESKEFGESENYVNKTIAHIEKKLKKSRRLLENNDIDIREASAYDKYLKFSDLLKINLNDLKRGMKQIIVANLHSEGEEIEIPLDAKLSPQENIKAYSRRYRKGKEGLALHQSRRVNISDEITRLSDAWECFQKDFEKASADFPELLPPTAGRTPKTMTPVVQLPYKTYLTSSGLTVFVGRSGDNNDMTTFKYARPYELWFHASQCPGSHVVLKYPNKNFQPSKQEIEETAAVAAYFSKARGSGRVPVNYTLRKYVRKPRKAKTGLVTIEREKTVFVAPRELERKE